MLIRRLLLSFEAMLIFHDLIQDAMFPTSWLVIIPIVTISTTSRSLIIAVFV